MHPSLVDGLVDRVRRRERQGDCPTEPVLSVEMLEDLVLELARSSTPTSRVRPTQFDIDDGCWVHDTRNERCWMCTGDMGLHPSTPDRSRPAEAQLKNYEPSISSSSAARTTLSEEEQAFIARVRAANAVVQRRLSQSIVGGASALNELSWAVGYIERMAKIIDRLSGAPSE